VTSDFVPRPEGAREYTLAMRPGLGDCAPSGRIRLDALARWLQDVAYADVEDAGLALSAVWVVRRNRIAIHRFPRFAERFIVRTFCSGLGRMWAERRTTIEPVDDAMENGDRPAGPAVEAVAIWVHLDPTDWRPTPFTEAEIAAYGGHAAGRRVTARLRHPAPAPDAAERGRWTFRATECDIANHVNNAAYWQPLEEELLARGDAEPATLDVEIEFRTPSQPGEKLVLADGNQRWIASLEREPHASLRLR
jgi:acyl-ACP thioesterase